MREYVSRAKTLPSGNDACRVWLVRDSSAALIERTGIVVHYDVGLASSTEKFGGSSKAHHQFCLCSTEQKVMQCCTLLSN